MAQVIEYTAIDTFHSNVLRVQDMIGSWREIHGDLRGVNLQARENYLRVYQVPDVSFMT